jgi:uncharacterized membrane protein
MNTLISAFLLGIATGERTFLGPAALAWSGDASYTTKGLLSVAEAGEIIGDLMPATPSRTEPPAFLARLVSGGSVGAVVARRADESQLTGAIAGALGAAVGTFGGARLRGLAIESIGAVPAALAEDVIAIGLAAAASALMRA